MNAIIKVRTLIEKVILTIGAILMFLISFFIMMQVVLRTMRIGVNWTEEVARFSFVAVTFLGSVLAVTKGYHISITFLAEMLPKPIKKILDIVIHIVMAGFMCVCTYGASLLMVASKGVRSNTINWFHLNYLYYLVMGSCILMVVAALLRAVEIATNRTEIAQGGEGEVT